MRRIIGIGFFVFALIGLVIGLGSPGEDARELILFAVFLFVLGLSLYPRKGNKKTELLRQSKLELKKIAKKTLFCSHMAGLPLAEGARCSIFFDEGRLSIEGGGTTFDLACNRISDMSIKSDVEIQSAYVSSAGGAVGGALLFGPLGAMVGGRVKKKETRTMESFLLITYDKDGEIAYLAFNVTGYLKLTYNLTEDFKNNYGVRQRRIEL